MSFTPCRVADLANMNGQPYAWNSTKSGRCMFNVCVCSMLFNACVYVVLLLIVCVCLYVCVSVCLCVCLLPL